jgi:hypothetical protein
MFMVILHPRASKILIFGLLPLLVFFIFKICKRLSVKYGSTYSKLYHFDHDSRKGYTHNGTTSSHKEARPKATKANTAALTAKGRPCIPPHHLHNFLAHANG